MSEIAIFENAAFGNVRVIMREGEPWFVASDVARALGYANPTKAIRDHCKYAELLKENESGPLVKSPFGIKVIPESDVYALIFRSNLPTAEDFRRWLCGEVLPAIRKHGGYLTRNLIEQILADPDYALQLVSRLAQERKANIALQARVDGLENALERNRGKLRIGESFSRGHACMSLAEAARELRQMVAGVEIGEKRLFKWLRKAGYLLKQKIGPRHVNLPTQLALERGLIKSERRQTISRHGYPVFYDVAVITRKGLEHFAYLFDCGNLHY